MSAVLNLSVFAVRSLFEGFCSSIGFPAGQAAADAAVKFLGARFTDHSAKLTDALSRATDGAWRALELSLAGDSWWDRIKATLARREDQVFREQVGAFLRTTPLANLPSHPPEFRASALRELRAARKAGALAGAVDPKTLAEKAGPFARFAEPQALLDAEWHALEALLTGLRDAGYPALAHFLSLRPHGDSPMLAVAVRYFFQRELEGDQALQSALSFARMERLAAQQEAGYDALASLLAKNTGRLDDLMETAAQTLAVVTETHADVKDIKSALDTMGQAVFRALAAPAAAPGDPVRKEEDVRLEMLNGLLTTPHRDLMPLWPVHQELCAKDPRFYVRLAAWYAEKGEVRDHKEAFVVALCLSPFEGHRDVGLALLRKMPPHQVARVVDFIHGRKVTRRRPRQKGQKKATREVVGDFGLFRTVPRSMRTEVERYLREREAAPAWFDSSVLQARKSLKRLYTVLHVKPSPRAQAVLFDDRPPPDSRLAALKTIKDAATPEIAAQAMLKAKLPFRVAVSVMPEITPPVLKALIGVMTPQEVINNLALLQRHGAMADTELRLLIDGKLEAAKADKRVSTFKAETALAAVGLGDELRSKLEEVTDLRIKARGRLRRSTGLLVDKSGSMEVAIDAGKRIAAMLSAACEQDLYVYAFDTMAYPIVAAGRDWADWKRAFDGINATGATSVGVALEVMRRKKQKVEQLIIVTDEEEYDPPFFIESYLKYRQELACSPTITFVKVPDSSTKLEDQCRRAGLTFSVFEFTGDYYALPNLVSLVEPPSQLDLLMEIMDTPLPERKGA